MANHPNIEDIPGTYAYDGMAALDDVDQFVDRAPGEGTGAYYGLQVAQNTGGAGDWTLNLSAGAGQLKGVTGGTYTNALTSATTMAVPSSTDRRDLVVWRVGTGVVVIKGTPWTPGAGDGAAYTRTSVGLPPVKPKPVSGTDVPLAEIYVPYNATALVTAMIVDKRPIVPLIAPQGMASFVPGTANSTKASMVNLAGAGGIGPSNIPDFCLRTAFTMQQTPVRTRLRVWDIQAVNNSVNPGVKTITGLWLGQPNTAAETVWSGDFVSAPTQELTSFTLDPSSNGSEYVSAWFTPPAWMVAGAQVGVSLAGTVAQTTITAMAISGTTVTVTAAAHGYVAGESVGIAGVASASGAGAGHLQTLVNGLAFTVASPTTNTFQINVASTPTDAYSSGGTVNPAMSTSVFQTNLCWTSSTPGTVSAGGVAGAAAAPTAGIASPGTAPLDIRLEYDYIGTASNVLYLGTSLSGGTVVGNGNQLFGLCGPDNRFPEKVALRAGQAALNGAIGGSSSSTYLSLTSYAWKRLLSPESGYTTLRSAPDVAVIEEGVNDLLPQVSLATFQSNILNVVANCKSIGASRVHLCTVPPSGMHAGFGFYGGQAGTLKSAVSGSTATVTVNGNAFTSNTTYVAGLGPAGGFPGPSADWQGNTFYLDLPESGICDGPYTATTAAYNSSGNLVLTPPTSFTPTNTHQAGAPVITAAEYLRRRYSMWIRQGVPGTAACIDLAEVTLQPGPEPRGFAWTYFANANPGPHPSDPSLYGRWAREAMPALAST